MSKGPQEELKYFKQYDSFSCGPIALMNALVWAGYNITYDKDFERISRAMKMDEDGASTHNLNKAIRRYKKLYVLPEEGSFEGPSIKLIDEHLSLGGSFIIGYFLTRKGKVYRNHYTFCVGSCGEQYTMINNGKRIVENVDRDSLVRMLRTKDEDGDEADIWFLFKAEYLKELI